MRSPIHVALLLATLAIPSQVFAHSGGLDKDGGHVDSLTGLWHYHGHGGGGGGFSGMIGPTPMVGPMMLRRAPQRTGRYDPRVQKERLARHAKRIATPPPAVDPRKVAETKLLMAKAMLKQGKKEAALGYLKELIDRFPATKAGKEGVKLRDQLTKKPSSQPTK